MRKQIGTRLLLILLTCAFSCSENGSVTGGGTDFPNTRTVAGVVLSSEGFPAKGVEVTAFNTHHNPLHGSEDTYPAVTDSSGIFHLSLPERGEFNLMAKSGNGTMGFKNRTVSVWDSPDTVRLATPGCALVVVRGTGTRSVYIRGTGFVSQVASGIATFDSLPAGTLPQIRTNGDASLSETLPVSSGEISTIADILFITGQDKAGTEAGDVELIGQLLKSGARVSAAEQTEIDSGRIDGCDVICISSSADTSGLPHRLSTVAKPLLNFNPLLQPGLYMTDTAEHIDFGTEN
ncbi:MAG: carboxypeptidase-like regulatory domain-containing protein, partial [Fibrobacterota bacterium]